MKIAKVLYLLLIVTPLEELVLLYLTFSQMCYKFILNDWEGKRGIFNKYLDKLYRIASDFDLMIWSQ